MATQDFILSTWDENPIDLANVHLSANNKNDLNQLLKEFKYISILNGYKLPVDNKLLLFGNTGCGKTTTAKAIARALRSAK